MEILIWVLVIGIGYFFFKKNAARGVRFVRAHEFLIALDTGESIESANEIAQFTMSKYDTTDQNAAIISAKSYANQHYGGKQLPVIAEALRKGFSQ